MLLCHNPSAGTKGYDKESILAALRLADHDVRYVSVKENGFRSKLDKSTDLVVVAGGDGTMAQVIVNLPDRSIPVALLPLGTANNFARSLGVAGTPQELVETWRIDHTRDVNIGTAAGPSGTVSFLEAFGIGAIPGFFHEVAKKKKPEGADNLRKGREALQRYLKKAKPFDVTMKFDGKTFERSVLGVEVCNITFTGPALPIAASADPGDGKLDVVYFETVDRKALIKWLDAPFDRRPPVTNRKIGKAEITWSAAPNRVDDEAFSGRDREQTVEIACDDEPVHILIPVKHPTQKTQAKKAAAS